MTKKIGTKLRNWDMRVLSHKLIYILKKKLRTVVCL